MTEKRVKIIGESRYGDYHRDDIGMVVSFMRDGEGTPCGVVIVGNRFVLVPVYSMEIL